MLIRGLLSVIPGRNVSIQSNFAAEQLTVYFSSGAPQTGQTSQHRSGRLPFLAVQNNVTSDAYYLIASVCSHVQCVAPVHEQIGRPSSHNRGTRGLVDHPRFLQLAP